MIRVNTICKPPRVLAVTSNTSFLRALRLEMPLHNLKRHGRIGDYRITNEFLQGLELDYAFDVLWLQRVSQPGILAHLTRTVGPDFLYDIDDLLIGNPTYNRCSILIDTGAIREALRVCRALAVPSSRLTALLEKYSGLDLQAKTFICPNGFEFSTALRPPEVPRGLLWTSSDFLALTHSKEVLVEAIDQFSRTRQLPVMAFGHFNEEVKSRIKNLVDLGPVDFWHHKTILSSLPVMIGVAPLETAGTSGDLDFIHSKSDLKMVEFGGLGHPAVYSAAPPYQETDLQAGVLVPNTKDAWLEALTTVYENTWRDGPAEQEAIARLRHMDRIAEEHWLPALKAVRLERPVSVRDIQIPRLSKMGLWGLYHRSDFWRGLKGRLPGPVRQISKKWITGGKR
jgi:hypothetical protein